MSSYELDYNCPQNENDKMGTIQRWPGKRNFGFIKQDDGNEDMFVHVMQVVSNQRLKRGMRVKYGVMRERQTGKFRAVGVHVVKDNDNEKENKKTRHDQTGDLQAFGLNKFVNKKKEGEKTMHQEAKGHSTLQEPMRRGGSGGGETMTFNPPDGIHVDIIPASGIDDNEAFQGAETPDGKRSLYFRDGTEYTIEIKNERKKRIGVLVSIDDRQATRTPLFIRGGSKRLIKGFTLSRKRVECTDASAGTRINTETEIEQFVARRQDQHSASGSHVDESLGEIRIKFVQVRFVNRPLGEHFNSLPKKNKSPTRGRARADVLVTEGGQHVTHLGYHATTNPRRPIWDKKKKILGVSGWTIFDRSTKKNDFLMGLLKKTKK